MDEGIGYTFVSVTYRKGQLPQTGVYAHPFSTGLVRQLDVIRVLPLPFVFFGKNFFEPLRLSLRRVLVHECGVMKYHKLLAATVTPKRAHLFESWRPLSHLALLDRHCFH